MGQSARNMLRETKIHNSQLENLCYSRLQLSLMVKQIEKFHIKGVNVGGDDFNKQATLFNVMNTRFDSVE